MTSGILNVLKPCGMTSHDVVGFLRRTLQTKKIGHGGTLDPDAAGVLPVFIGTATRLLEYAVEGRKNYRAELKFGIKTDTGDDSGTIIASSEVRVVTEAEIQETLQKFIGEQKQIPPMYSALKVGGKKLYELAREGKSIERKPRNIKIYNIDILKVELPRVKMRVHCSKGTYIRTLCHDIGESLGCGGCMEELLRTQVSRFQLENAYTLSQIEESKEKGKLEELILPIDEMFSEYPKAVVMDRWKKLIYNGNPFPDRAVLDKLDVRDEEPVRVYDQEEHFIGLYRYRAAKKDYTIMKMFFDQESL